jgi:hypothetical protein
MKEYILKPIMTPATVNLRSTADKPAVARPLPPRQPLPTAVLDPAKPLLKLGLDVHLDFIMAVAQKDHANPHAPRKFTRAELLAHVRAVDPGRTTCRRAGDPALPHPGAGRPALPLRLRPGTLRVSLVPRKRLRLTRLFRAADV